MKGETDIKQGLEHAYEMLSGNLNLLWPFVLSAVATIIIFGISILMMLPFAGAFAGLDAQTFIASNLPLFAVIIGFNALLSLFTNAFFDSMAFTMCREAWQKGHARLKMSYGFRYLFQFIKIDVLVCLAFLGVFVLFSLPVAIFANSAGLVVPFMALLALALLVVGVALIIGFFWAKAAMVAEDKGVIETLKRSWRFAFKNLFDTVFLIIFFIALAVCISLIQSGLDSIPWPGALGLLMGALTYVAFLLVGFAISAFMVASKVSIFLAAKSTPRPSPRPRKR